MSHSCVLFQGNDKLTQTEFLLLIFYSFLQIALPNRLFLVAHLTIAVTLISSLEIWPRLLNMTSPALETPVFLPTLEPGTRLRQRPILVVP